MAGAANSNTSHGSTASSTPSSALHSVRKPPAKPWKKPGPLPIPPNVYRVDPRDFRQLVQSLTGAADLAPDRGRLQQDAAAPVPMPQPAPPPVQQAFDVLHGGASLWASSPSTTWELPLGFSAGEAAVTEPPQTSADAGYQFSQVYPAADIPSPSLYSACLTWCNLPLLSPGSMACLEQSTVL